MNKRASISTFVFVMMVLITCVYTVWSFSKQVDESGKELLDVSVGMESRVMQEKADIYLRLISEKAAVLAFNESYYRFSFLRTFEEDGKNKEIRIVGFFDNAEYNSFFLEKFKEHFTKLVEDYPEDILDKDTKNVFKNSNFYFDGKDMRVLVGEYYKNYSINGVSLNSSSSAKYNNSLFNLGLPNLSKLSNIDTVCSNKDKYISCFNENLPEIEFYSNNGDKTLIFKTKYLDKDINLDYKLIIYKTKKSYYLFEDNTFKFDFNILILSAQQSSSNYVIDNNYLSYQNSVFSSVSSN